MSNNATENGAEFRKDLTKSVTHLVARSTEGEKYRFATQWNIKVVTVKWFHDSLERGMVLDEEKYHPQLPLEEQGVGAWIRLPSVKRLIGKERTAADDSPSNSRPRKKLRRTASTKLVGQNENIWGDIVGAGFLNDESTESRNGEMDEPSFEKPKPIIQAVKSFASETTVNETLNNRQPEVPAKVHAGFLAECHFFIHGFSPKQVSDIVLASSFGSLNRNR